MIAGRYRSWCSTASSSTSARPSTAAAAAPAGAVTTQADEHAKFMSRRWGCRAEDRIGLAEGTYPYAWVASIKPARVNVVRGIVVHVGIAIPGLGIAGIDGRQARRVGGHPATLRG